MDLHEAIRMRKSIRAFMPEPVPLKLIEKILSEAIRSPSAENIQGWEFALADKEATKRMGLAFRECISNHAPIRPDIRVPQRWEGIYDKRGKTLGKALFNHIGIKRADRDKRRDHYFRMYDFFGAPNAILIFIDELVCGYDWAIFDAGLITQNIVLLAVAEGLGTCIEGAVTYYPDIAREILSIPASKKLIIGIAIGYPDLDSQINRFRSTREPLESFLL